LRLRCLLWPGEDGDHEAEVQRFFDGDRTMPAEVLIAWDDARQAVGLAEVSFRSVVEGCEPGKVGFLEGWFVAQEHRRKGVGGMLVRAAEEWARDQGCAEFGSDTEIDNTVSIAAHKALGFEETERLVCFRKNL
ncbi:MAG TPA: aminoglycoside 6'-N-acetyltransferase, partial [Chloroflexota bacterium]